MYHHFYSLSNWLCFLPGHGYIGLNYGVLLYFVFSNLTNVTWFLNDQNMDKLKAIIV